MGKSSKEIQTEIKILYGIFGLGSFLNYVMFKGWVWEYVTRHKGKKVYTKIVMIGKRSTNFSRNVISVRALRINFEF